MEYDEKIDLAIGHSARSKVWKNQEWSWSKLVEKLQQDSRTRETLKEFQSATKEEKLKIKDVGGYVGGYLKNGRRKPAHVVHRQLVTLDIDFAHSDFWDDLTLQFHNACVLHSTHSHSPEDPRFRLIMPLSRKVDPDEYVAVSRKVAGLLGIDLFDNTTFETNRLMFWPSTSVDAEYYCQIQDGPWLDPDEILSMYPDWKDSSLWPTATNRIPELKEREKKQADPTQKKGLVGAFCRAYPIEEVIEKHLQEVYVPAGEERYTYTKGTTSSGLTIHDGLFAYSHHGTDPASGKLCNAFDLVRVHKFGHLDPSGDLTSTTTPSYKAMEEFCRKDDQVKKVIATEKIQETKSDFGQKLEDSDLEWTKMLEIDPRGNYLSSSTNLNIIFSNDPRLKNRFRENLFDGKKYVFHDLPWRRIPRPEPLKNVDFSGVRNYIESVYGIVGALKIEDALSLEFEKHSFHPVRDYLSQLEWDGQKRVDTLLVDYFGARDTYYTRQAIRKTLAGSVARVYRPGIKFDLVLTLVGDQGTGKSTFVNKLGGPWFSDTFLTVQGKEGLEQIQGAWLIEMAELAGLRKAEVEAIKHFISKQEDVFRPAYGRTSETYRRQCVFVGTTNSTDFLRDPSGNRRFMPVAINPLKATKQIFKDLDLERDQIWAEAVDIYLKGEPLYLDKVAESQALEEQKLHSEVDNRRGLVQRYLETLLPTNWEDLGIYERRNYLEDPLSPRGTQERDYVCIAEIWCECLGKSKDDMTRYNTRDLHDLMKGLDEWEQINSTREFPIYGRQRYYVRKLF